MTKGRQNDQFLYGLLAVVFLATALIFITMRKSPFKVALDNVPFKQVNGIQINDLNSELNGMQLDVSADLTDLEEEINNL